jgi:L-rhamnose mutarotase
MKQPLRLLRNLSALCGLIPRPRRILGIALLLCLLSLGSYAQNASNTSVLQLQDMTGKPLPPARLQALCQKQGLPVSSIYSWRNYLVVYGPTEQIKELMFSLKKDYTKVRLQFYDAPFYRFDRSSCADKTLAKRWDNVILTTQLVEDTLQQRRYLTLHRQQAQEWPEVSQGFCNASFQQLLVFEQNQQVLVIISVPKGKTLDELNPKTTENNPRVDEWNQLMKQFQRPLPEADSTQTWVSFEPVPAPQTPVKK